METAATAEQVRIKAERKGNRTVDQRNKNVFFVVVVAVF